MISPGSSHRCYPERELLQREEGRESLCFLLHCLCKTTFPPVLLFSCTICSFCCSIRSLLSTSSSPMMMPSLRARPFFIRSAKQVVVFNISDLSYREKRPCQTTPFLISSLSLMGYFQICHKSWMKRICFVTEYLDSWPDSDPDSWSVLSAKSKFKITRSS